MKEIIRFTQPDVLYEIGSELLCELFNHFKEDLADAGVPIPNPNQADGHYYESVAALFKAHETLPPKLVEAVLAIESLASPESKQRLEAAFHDSPQELYLEPTDSPEHAALALWLQSPYPPGEPPSSAEALVTAVAPVVIQAPPQPTLAPPNPQPPTRNRQSNPLGNVRRRNGKVAGLPKETRDRINVMLSDGLTYAAIIKALGEEGAALNEANISNWQLGGYKDWLAEQKEREDMGLWEEYTLELVKQNANSTLSEAAIRMATVQIRQALRAIGHTGLQTAMQENPESHIRLLNSLSRLTSGGLSCQNERRKQEQRDADAQRQQADPDSLSITAETLRKIEKLLRLR